MLLTVLQLRKHHRNIVTTFRFCQPPHTLVCERRPFFLELNLCITQVKQVRKSLHDWRVSAFVLRVLSESRFEMLSTYFYDNLNGTPAPRKPIRLMSDPNFDAIHLIRSPAFKPHHAHAHMCSRCADISRECCPCARVCGGGGVFDDQSIAPNVCHFGTQPPRRVCAAAPLGFVEFPDWNGIMMAIGAL